jgi:hypothetical protein
MSLCYRFSNLNREANAFPAACGGVIKSERFGRGGTTGPSGGGPILIGGHRRNGQNLFSPKE